MVAVVMSAGGRGCNGGGGGRRLGVFSRDEGVICGRVNGAFFDGGVGGAPKDALGWA